MEQIAFNFVPTMPKEYVGKYLKGCQYVKNTPREWTEKETEWVLALKEQGFNSNEIARSVGRQEVSVSIKLKRLKKKNDSYNEKHREEKYKANETFLECLNPGTVLDLYAGPVSYYKARNWNTVSNDKNKAFEHDYNLDSLKLLCHLFYEGKQFDLIDLDPYGSAAECFDLAIKMAKKGLIITLGEMGHKRFKRLDFVKRFYGINSLKDFTEENIISKIQEKALCHRKTLTVIACEKWKNVSRVYFEIEPYKITEQWQSS